MAAEAILRGAEGGSRTEALEYVNEIRDRAYMSANMVMAYRDASATVG